MPTIAPSDFQDINIKTKNLELILSFQDKNKVDVTIFRCQYRKWDDDTWSDGILISWYYRYNIFSIWTAYPSIEDAMDKLWEDYYMLMKGAKCTS